MSHLKSKPAWLTGQAVRAAGRLFILTRGTVDLRAHHCRHLMARKMAGSPDVAAHERANHSAFEGPRDFRSTGKVSVAAQSGPWARRACREEEALFRRADYLGPAAGGRGHGGGRYLSPGRDLRADVLSLEESLRRDAAGRGAGTQAAARGKHEAEAARRRPVAG